LPSALHSWPWAHATHAAPFKPQDPFADVWHAPVESQHPVAQPASPAQLHAWFSHVCEDPHVAHIVPPEPQAAGVFPCWHTPFESQQPVAHVLGPHPASPPSMPPASEASSPIIGASTVESSVGPVSGTIGVVESISVLASSDASLSPE
jgi:hypothetical protein